MAHSLGVLAVLACPKVWPNPPFEVPELWQEAPFAAVLVVAEEFLRWMLPRLGAGRLMASSKFGTVYRDLPLSERSVALAISYRTRLAAQVPEAGVWAQTG